MENILPLLSFLLCWFLCGKVREKLLAKGVLDTPNERSLHAAPVPRGGGIALWLSVITLWFLYDLGGYRLPGHVMLMIGTLCLIVVSWMDDKKPLPPEQRIFIHIIAVALGLSTLPLDQYVFGDFLPLWADRFLAGFCWLWFINLTNFMDGMDGMSGANGIHIALGFLLVSSIAIPSDLNDGIIALALIGGLFGFLMWNWHPARLFLGDVGSIPLGYLLGYLMLVLATEGFLAIALTLPLYYVADASITLLRRIFERKRFWEAHREHYYQKAAVKSGRHSSVLIPIILANMGLLLLAVLSLYTGFWLLFAAPLLVGLLLWYLKRLATTETE